MAGLGLCSLFAVLFDPQGKLYNVRFLPLWFLCAYLLAGIGVAEVFVLGAKLWRSGTDRAVAGDARTHSGLGVEPGRRGLARGRADAGSAAPPVMDERSGGDRRSDRRNASSRA